MSDVSVKLIELNFARVRNQTDVSHNRLAFTFIHHSSFTFINSTFICCEIPHFLEDSDQEQQQNEE